MRLRRTVPAICAIALCLSSCYQDPVSVLNQPLKALAATSPYTSNFDATESPISEGGNWLSGQAVGLDWGDVATSNGIAHGVDNDGEYSDPTAILTGTWPADQSVEATVYTVNQNSSIYQEVELRLRSTLSAHVNKGYEVYWRCLKTSAAYATIVRWNGALGNFTVLSEKNGSAYGVKNGDVVKATVVGNVITQYLNGVQIAQVTDNSFTSGNPGIGFDFGCNGTYQDHGFTNITATGLGGGSNAAPTVATTAAANPSSVTAKTSNLSVLGADDNGEAALKYTWAATTVPSGGTASFSVNGTNAAKNTTATFNKAGSYTLRATITDAGGLTVTSSVNVAVSQTITTVAVTPATASIATSGTLQFTASAKDQFGTALTAQPTFTWTATGGGTIGSAGLFTAGSTAGGPYTVTASSSSKSGTANVTVIVPGSGSDTLEVTNANAKYSLVTMTLPTGFRGTQFEKFNGATDSAQWNYSAVTAGTYTLTFRYLANTGTGTLALKVNGTTINSAVNFHSGTSNTWNTVAQANVSLISGVNKICLKGGAVSPNFCNVDYMVVSGGGPANQAPTVATAASASPSTVTGTTSTVSVLGADNGGEAALTYTWAATTVPSGGTATFSVNGTNAAKNTVATFNKAGSYTLRATIKDAGNLTVTSSVVVTVSQTLTTITVSPSSASVVKSATQQFTASAVDQFGTAMTVTYTWTVSGGGTISASGLFTAGTTAGGPYTVTATSGGKSGTASVTVTAGSASHTIKIVASDDGIVFDKFQYFNGSAWINVLSTSASITYSGWGNTGTCTDPIRYSTYGGDYAQLTFAGTGVRVYDNGASWNFDVYIDGVKQTTVSPISGPCVTKQYEKTGL